MTAMTWTVTNVASGANEFIIFDNFEIALTDGNSVITDIDNMTIQVSLVGTTATLSFSDVSVSAAQLRNLINDMSYKNTSQDPSTADRVMTITELVDTGSNAAPGRQHGGARHCLDRACHPDQRRADAGRHRARPDLHRGRRGGRPVQRRRWPRRSKPARPSPR